MSLSMVCTGLGQLYCGQARRGLLMYSAALSLTPLVMAAALTASSSTMLIGFLVTLCGAAALYIWSVVDACRLARASVGVEWEPRDYNHASVYTLMTVTSAFYTVAMVLFLRSNVIEAFVLPSDSMAPTFVRGDRVLTNKLGIATRTLPRGELVVFRNPQNRQQNFIKRIVGLPGDTIEMKDGAVLINDQPLEREPAPASVVPRNDKTTGKDAFWERNGDRRYAVLVTPQDEHANLPPVTVPAGAVYVLGDHRGLSLDSRIFGAISQAEIVGVVTARYYPAHSWQRFGCVQ